MMNEYDIVARIRERQREVRRIEASAWQLPTRGISAGGPPKTRTSGLRRAVGGWLMGVGRWVAGTPAGSTTGSTADAPGAPGGRLGSA